MRIGWNEKRKRCCTIYFRLRRASKVTRTSEIMISSLDPREMIILMFVMANFKTHELTKWTKIDVYFELQFRWRRLLNPAFPDGLSAPRISVTGNNLPLARVVSRTMHPDEGFHDHAGTVMVIAWGQFMDHDYTLTGTPLGKVNY